MSAAAGSEIDAGTQTEIGRLAALGWRDYEAERVAAARALGMRLRDLDRDVYRMRGAATAERLR